MTTDARHLETEQLSALIDDRLAPDERTAAEAHLAACHQCRQELASLHATVELLRGLPPVQPPRSFRLPEPLPARPPLAGRLAAWMRVASSLAAAVFVLLLAVDLLGAGAGQPATPVTAPAPAPRSAAPALKAAPAASPEAGPPAARSAAQPPASATPASAAPPEVSAPPAAAQPAPPTPPLRGWLMLTGALAVGLLLISLLLARLGRPAGPA